MAMEWYEKGKIGSSFENKAERIHFSYEVRLVVLFSLTPAPIFMILTPIDLS